MSSTQFPWTPGGLELLSQINQCIADYGGREALYEAIAIEELGELSYRESTLQLLDKTELLLPILRPDEIQKVLDISPSTYYRFLKVILNRQSA